MVQTISCRPLMAKARARGQSTSGSWRTKSQWDSTLVSSCQHHSTSALPYTSPTLYKLSKWERRWIMYTLNTMPVIQQRSWKHPDN